jgi:hypothetical protein
MLRTIWHRLWSSEKAIPPQLPRGYNTEQTDMRKPVEITTPYPSLERVASIYGVSKKRQAAISEIVDAMYSKRRSTLSAAPNKHASAKTETPVSVDPRPLPKIKKRQRAKAKSRA